jgi:hypothetical protein
MLNRQRRLTAWITAFAVVLQALWPLLSHARPKDQSLLVPVCSIEGVAHYIDLRSGKTPLDDRSTSHGEHCKLCVFGSDRTVALPLDPVALLAVLDIVVEQLIAKPVPLPEPLNHPPAQPRAPPQSF